jgi:hypothetical protein
LKVSINIIIGGIGAGLWDAAVNIKIIIIDYFIQVIFNITEMDIRK